MRQQTISIYVNIRLIIRKYQVDNHVEFEEFIIKTCALFEIKKQNSDFNVFVLKGIPIDAYMKE